MSEICCGGMLFKKVTFRLPDGLAAVSVLDNVSTHRATGRSRTPAAGLCCSDAAPLGLRTKDTRLCVANGRCLFEASASQPGLCV